MKQGVFRGVGIIVSIIGLIAFAGCGGNGSSSGESAITKKQFLQEANTLCRQYENKRVEAMSKVAKTFSPNEDVTKNANGDKLVLAGVAVFKEMTERLAGLQAPEGDEQKVEEIIAAMESSIERAEAEPKQVFNGNAVFGPAEEKFSEYGLTDCVGGSG